LVFEVNDHSLASGEPWFSLIMGTVLLETTTSEFWQETLKKIESAGRTTTKFSRLLFS
jgi:hypothetical protein